MRVLVTEDDPSVSAALAGALTRAGHTCDRVASGAALLQQYRSADIVLLDLGLEDMDGLTALEQLHALSEIPVIVVTARGDERSTVQALRLGADDYLVKPVRLHELLARLAAVARRYAGLAVDRIELGDCIIDETERQVLHDGATIALTPTECALLAMLARHVGAVVSRQRLLDAVWGEAYSATSRAFDVHLAGLRQKVPMLRITTIRGRGFRLERP